MTLQEVKNQALQLPTVDRWQLVQVLLDSLKQEANPKMKRGKLSHLLGFINAEIPIVLPEDINTINVSDFR